MFVPVLVIVGVLASLPIIVNHHAGGVAVSVLPVTVHIAVSRNSSHRLAWIPLGRRC
jgi:hypothetical protein